MDEASETADWRHRIGIGQDRQVPRHGPGQYTDPGRGGSREYLEECTGLFARTKVARYAERHGVERIYIHLFYRDEETDASSFHVRK